METTYPDARPLLGVLLDGQPYTLGELQRELGWPLFRLDDAVANLRRTGLAHARADIVWASRAELAFDALGV